MTATEVRLSVERLWASRELQPEDNLVIFEDVRLETDQEVVEMFRRYFPNLPLRRGFWWVYGKEQCPPGEWCDPEGPTFMVDDETGTIVPFLTL